MVVFAPGIRRTVRAAALCKRRRKRETKIKARSLAGVAAIKDCPAVGIDDLPDDCQSESCPSGLVVVKG